jgi:hypothetical protein
VQWGSPAHAQNPQDPNAKVFRCAPDRDQREEIDRAVRDHFATFYQNDCQGFQSGRSFDIQMEQIRVQGKSAFVSYVVAFFETCEEGAPISELSRHKEYWVRGTSGWEPEEIAARSAH